MKQISAFSAGALCYFCLTTPATAFVGDKAVGIRWTPPEERVDYLISQLDRVVDEAENEETFEDVPEGETEANEDEGVCHADKPDDCKKPEEENTGPTKHKIRRLSDIDPSVKKKPEPIYEEGFKPIKTTFKEAMKYTNEKIREIEKAPKNEFDKDGFYSLEKKELKEMLFSEISCDLNNDKHLTVLEIEKCFNVLMDYWMENEVEKIWKNKKTCPDLNEDGLVSEDEIIAVLYDFWKQKEKEEAEKFNKPGDEQYNFKISNLDDEDIALMEHQQKRAWESADLNGNGLGKNEYKAFLFPTRFQRMHQHLFLNAIESMDFDLDEKISMGEWAECQYNKELPRSALFDNEEYSEILRNEFNKWDLDGDEKLDDDEVRHWLIPERYRPVREEIVWMFKKLDKDNDEYLSMEEILEDHTEFMNFETVNVSELIKFKDEL